jgi:CHAT domain-containing protein/tetratricopeptide (TPR) repeat protein
MTERRVPVGLKVIIAASVLAVLMHVVAMQPAFAGMSGDNTEIDSPPPVVQLLNEVDSLVEDGAFDSAMTVSRQALRLVEHSDSAPDTVVAQCLQRLACCYFEQCQYHASDSLYRLAHSIMVDRFGPESLQAGRLLYHVGRVTVYLDNPDEQVALLEKSLNIMEHWLGPSSPELVPVLQDLAYAITFRDEIDKSEELLMRSLSIAELAPEDRYESTAKTLSYLGCLRFYQGRVTEADSLYQLAINLITEHLGPDHYALARPLRFRGLLRDELFLFGQAIQDFSRALKLQVGRHGRIHPLNTFVMGGMAGVYIREGRFERAEPLIEEGLSIYRKTIGPHHSWNSPGLATLGDLFLMQGKPVRAEQLYRQALALNSKLDSISSTQRSFPVFNSLALALFEQGKRAESESIFRQQLELKEKYLGPDNYLLCQTLSNLGYIAYLKEDYPGSLRYLERAHALLTKAFGKDNPRTLQMLSFMGDAQLALGHYDAALRSARQAYEIFVTKLAAGHPLIVSNLTLLGDVYAVTSQYDSCCKYLSELVQEQYNTVAKVLTYSSQEQRLRYIQKYPLINDLLLTICHVDSSQETRRAAFDMIVRGKSVALDAIIGDKKAAVCNESEEVRSIAARRSAVCGEISSLMLENELGPASVSSGTYTLLHAQKDSLELELSRVCSEFIKNRPADTLSSFGLANLMPDRSLIVEYVEYQYQEFKSKEYFPDRQSSPRYMALTLDASGEIGAYDLGPAEKIDSLIQRSRRIIADSHTKLHSPMARLSEELLAETTGKLYQILIEPLADRLVGKSSVIISPDGMLHLLPFEILATSDSTYLIEQYELSYVSSSRDLLDVGPKQVARNAIIVGNPDFETEIRSRAIAEPEPLDTVLPSLAIGPPPVFRTAACLQGPLLPLRYAGDEASAVKIILSRDSGFDVRFYSGPEASESVLKAMEIAPRVVHLATHGFYCDEIDSSQSILAQNPLLKSGVILAGANRTLGSKSPVSGSDDGIMTALEASSLNLVGTELVVLSACQSGVGETISSEGVFGLRRAFQQAGAEAVVMSLWDVPDKETSQLMKRFYQGWVNGTPKQEAFRAAKLSLLKESRRRNGHGHPLLWGGFVMIGNPLIRNLTKSQPTVSH